MRKLLKLLAQILSLKFYPLNLTKIKHEKNFSSIFKMSATSHLNPIFYSNYETGLTSFLRDLSYKIDKIIVKKKLHLSDVLICANMAQQAMMLVF